MYFRFPQNAITRSKLLAAIGLTNCVIDKILTICSDHFIEDDYKQHTKLRFLKETAISVSAYL